jgi:RNA polymerase primary sigma factor
MKNQQTNDVSRMHTNRVMNALTSCQRKVYLSISDVAGYMPNDAFFQPDAESRFFGNDASQIDTPGWDSFVPDTDSDGVFAGCKVRLTGAQERELFFRYNFARYRLAELTELQLAKPLLTRAREMVRWMTRVLELRATLTTANLPLVIAMAKRSRVPNVDFGDLVSEGNMALLRAIDKFDADRGFKFSTYGCRAILKGFNRMATKMGKYRSRFPVEWDPALEKSDYDVKRHEMEMSDSVDSLRVALDRNDARLSDTERMVVAERFALNGQEKKSTLAQVGEKMGLTNERIRQIQKGALAKLRSTLRDQYQVA